MPARLAISTLILAGGLAVASGADGYLRQGRPLALRFAAALIPPPPVNERILALGKPVAPPPDDFSEFAAKEIPSHLQPAIENLISKPAPMTVGTVVDTAAPTSVSSKPEDVLPLPEPGPVVPPATSGAAELIPDILGIFSQNRRGLDGRGNSAVVVAPTAFLPPQTVQPAPSSRAVYQSQ